MTNNNYSIKEKICVVTGSNSGIGKHTALGLTKMDAKVIMACRNEKFGQKALEEIKANSGNDSVELMILDLASIKSIHQFVNNFKSKYENLHVLINNAGVYEIERKETLDGFEINFGTNYLGPFLLTNLLLDIIKSSAPSRIINVSSHYCKYAKINFDDLQSKEKFEVTHGTISIPYCQSKLALSLFTFELAERLNNADVTVNCLCPGFVRKDDPKRKTTTEPSFFIKLAAKLFIKRISPEKAAEIPIYLASSPEVEGITGKLFENKQISTKYNKHFDKETGKLLWKVSEKLTGLKP